VREANNTAITSQNHYWSVRWVGGAGALEILAEGEVLVAGAVDDLVLLLVLAALNIVLLLGDTGVGRSRGFGGAGTGAGTGAGDGGSVHRGCGGDRGSLAGRGTSVDGHVGDGRRADFVTNAKNFADVDVGAFFVDLGVVAVEDGAVDTVVVPDSAASIALLDDVGVRAILSFGGEADGIANNEVAAGFIDLASVNSTQLVRGDVVCGRDAVADVTGLDGVGARAFCSVGNLCEAGHACDGEKAGGVSEHG